MGESRKRRRGEREKLLFLGFSYAAMFFVKPHCRLLFFESASGSDAMILALTFDSSFINEITPQSPTDTNKFSNHMIYSECLHKLTALHHFTSH